MKYWWLVFLFFFFLSRFLPAADWTFMVYLDGDNGLEKFASDDFCELGKTGSTAEVNIVVQYDRCEQGTAFGEDYYTSDYGNWTKTRRFHIAEGMEPDTTDFVSLGELNMGDPDTLKDFIIWSSTAYPANHYVLILWNHGGGWRAKNQSSRLRSKWDDTTVVPYVGTNRRVCPSLLTAGRQSPVSRVVCWDEDNEDDVLFMAEVREAIREAGVPLDIVGFDACLMGMLEVDYALRDLCDFVVASEEVEPNSGWPYEDILNALIANPGMTPQQLATAIVSNYSSYYSGGHYDYPPTLAAVDMETLTSVCAEIDRFADLSVYWKKGSPEWAGIKYARQNCSVYYGNQGCQSIDLYKFFELVKSTSSIELIRDNAGALLNATSDYVVAYYSFSGDDYGRAIYFPETLDDYQNDSEGTYHPYNEDNDWNPVDYVQDHQWDNFIWRYYNPPENIPPEKITDLVALTGETAWSIKLTWTAPADEDSADGNADHYILIYSDIKYPDIYWEYSQSWSPEPSGQAETRILTGLRGGTTYYFAIKAVDQEGEKGLCSNSSFAFCKPDTSSPQEVGFVNDGESEDIQYVNGFSGLSANWGNAFDPESGIVSYWFAIGTVPDFEVPDVWDWTNNSLDTRVTVPELSLQEETTYYFGVKAINGEGLESDVLFSDGQTVISQNLLLVYPTIFRPLQGEKLHIKYKIANEGRVQINVYNIAGEHIDILLDEERPVEENSETSWKGTNQEGWEVSSGIYLIHISAAKFQATKKCALIK